MSFTRYPFEMKSEVGYFSLLGGFRGLGLYLLLGVAFATSIIGFDPADALSFLSFPLVLGLAMISGLLFRYSGAIASFLIILVVGLLLTSSDTGIFANMSAEQGYFFVLAKALATGLFSTISALAFGYNLRRTELATSRQNLLHKVFDALPIGIWVRARDGRSIFVNDRWAEFSPYSADEIVDLERTRIPIDLGKDWDQWVSRVVETDNSAVHYKNIELENGAGERSSMTLLTIRIFIDQEDDFGTLSLLIDETALRAYEARIQQSEQNLHLALNNAKMGFWTEDTKTGKRHYDDNWFRLIDASREADKAPVAIWSDRLHPEDREEIQRAYRDFYVAGGDTTRLVYRMRKGRDQYIWVQDSILATERAEDGSALCTIGTVQDITEQKEAQIELTLAKEKAEAANQAKDQFIATISHEIRTPLNAIIGLSSFLTEGDLEEDHLDLAQTIHSSGKNLLSLVNEVLDFSKIEAGRLRLERQEFPLRLCLHESTKLFRVRTAEKNVELNLKVANDLPEFGFGDMERLRQVLQNLLSNALKFTDEGSVSLSARAVDASELNPDCYPSWSALRNYGSQTVARMLEVRVKDTGVGIPRERQHMLFQAFSQVDASTTRRHGGTGLGLVICKRLVDAMGGCIWAESEVGKGAEFCFIVPILFSLETPHAAEPLQSPDRSGDKEFAHLHPLDILIVGPDESTVEWVQACRDLGYAPHHSGDYDLDGSAFGHRDYELVLIVLDRELKALELARKVSTSGYAMRPESMIGLASEEQDFSLERCRLNGLGEVVRGAPGKEALEEAIKRVVSARG